MKSGQVRSLDRCFSFVASCQKALPFVCPRNQGAPLTWGPSETGAIVDLPTETIDCVRIFFRLSRGFCLGPLAVILGPIIRDTNQLLSLSLSFFFFYLKVPVQAVKSRILLLEVIFMLVCPTLEALKGGDFYMQVFGLSAVKMACFLVVQIGKCVYCT